MMESQTVLRPEPKSRTPEPWEVNYIHRIKINPNARMAPGYEPPIRPPVQQGDPCEGLLAKAGKQDQVI